MSSENYWNRKIEYQIEKLDINKANALQMVLDFMKKHGSSVLLNWGEDNDLWECSWITGDSRFTGFSTSIVNAVKDCLLKAKHEGVEAKLSPREWNLKF